MSAYFMRLAQHSGLVRSPSAATRNEAAPARAGTDDLEEIDELREVGAPQAIPTIPVSIARPSAPAGLPETGSREAAPASDLKSHADRIAPLSQDAVADGRERDAGPLWAMSSEPQTPSALAPAERRREQDPQQAVLREVMEWIAAAPPAARAADAAPVARAAPDRADADRPVPLRAGIETARIPSRPDRARSPDAPRAAAPAPEALEQERPANPLPLVASVDAGERAVTRRSTPSARDGTPEDRLDLSIGAIQVTIEPSPAPAPPPRAAAAVPATPRAPLPRLRRHYL